jgi:hypothetical protein
MEEEEEEAIEVGLGCLRCFSRIALLTGIATSACWSGSALRARREIVPQRRSP